MVVKVKGMVGWMDGHETVEAEEAAILILKSATEEVGTEQGANFGSMDSVGKVGCSWDQKVIRRLKETALLRLAMRP